MGLLMGDDPPNVSVYIYIHFPHRGSISRSQRISGELDWIGLELRLRLRLQKISLGSCTTDHAPGAAAVIEGPIFRALSLELCIAYNHTVMLLRYKVRGDFLRRLCRRARGPQRGLCHIQHHNQGRGTSSALNGLLNLTGITCGLSMLQLATEGSRVSRSTRHTTRASGTDLFWLAINRNTNLSETIR
jgi:hypothetical protein